eukprot:4247490-Pleurochrysis_carterae.AAC.1
MASAATSSAAVAALASPSAASLDPAASSFRTRPAYVGWPAEAQAAESLAVSSDRDHRVCDGRSPV